MRVSAVVVSLIVIFIGGCSTTTYKQSSVDTVPEKLGLDRGLIIFDASIFEKNEPLLVIIKDINRVESFGDNKIEFTNYPGTVLPFYASDKPYHMHAYYVNSGDYEISGCVYGPPEINRCAPGRWIKDGAYAGPVRFSVRGGEVVNLGHLHIDQIKTEAGTVRTVTVIKNENSASEYIREYWPQYLNKLVHRPFQL